MPRSRRRYSSTKSIVIAPSTVTRVTGVSVSGAGAVSLVKMSTSPLPSVNRGASKGRARSLLMITASGSADRPIRSRLSRASASLTMRP